MVHVEVGSFWVTAYVGITKFLQEITNMKKLIAMTIGLGLVLGTVSFAQDADKKTEKKKGKKKTEDKGDKKM